MHEKKRARICPKVDDPRPKVDYSRPRISFFLERVGEKKRTLSLFLDIEFDTLTKKKYSIHVFFF